MMGDSERLEKNAKNLVKSFSNIKEILREAKGDKNDSRNTKRIW